MESGVDGILGTVGSNVPISVEYKGKGLRLYSGGALSPVSSISSSVTVNVSKVVNIVLKDALAEKDKIYFKGESFSTFRDYFFVDSRMLVLQLDLDGNESTIENTKEVSITDSSLTYTDSFEDGSVDSAGNFISNSTNIQVNLFFGAHGKGSVSVSVSIVEPKSFSNGIKYATKKIFDEDLQYFGGKNHSVEGQFNSKILCNIRRLPSV